MIIDLKRIEKIIDAGKTHPPHDQENLCSSCIIKRQLWQSVPLALLCQKISKIAVDELALKVTQMTLEDALALHILEFICIGFDLANSYLETEKLDKEFCAKDNL